MDFELLKKRREKYLKLQKELGEEQHIGLGYVLTVEGKQYPVMSCFSVSGETEDAKDKLKYLINGRKSSQNCFSKVAGLLDRVVICCCRILFGLI